MKAWSIQQYGSIEDLQLLDHEPPVPNHDEILIAVKSAALNPADIKVLTGRDGGRFLHAKNFPLVLGFDYSGVVESVGSEIKSLQKGEEVFGFLPYSTKNRQGSLAEYVVVRPENVGLKPVGVSHEEAASASTVACTALQALRDRGKLSSGQRVLVNGASGGVGAYAVQMAKNAGAEVVGTASERNLDFVRSMGADHVVDYRAEPIGQLKGPFHIFLDASATSSYSECLSILQGTYVTLLPSLSLIAGMLQSLFSVNRCTFVGVRPRASDLNTIGKDLDAGRLKAPISRKYPMSEAPKAFQYLYEGDKPGKVVLSWE